VRVTALQSAKVHGGSGCLSDHGRLRLRRGLSVAQLSRSEREAVYRWPVSGLL